MTDSIKQTFINLLEQWIPMHKFYGVQVLEIADGYAKLLIPFKNEHIGDPRTLRLHGGFIASAVDFCGGAAALTRMKSPEDDVATADMRVDYLRPGQAKDIIAEGKIIHKTARTIFTEMKIFHSDSEEPIALGRGVFTIKHKN